MGNVGGTESPDDAMIDVELTERERDEDEDEDDGGENGTDRSSNSGGTGRVLSAAELFPPCR